MRLHHNRDGGLDPVHLELAAVALVMALLGGAIYYYGSLYDARAQTTHVTRSVSMF